MKLVTSGGRGFPIKSILGNASHMAEVPISGAPAFYVSWETERYTPSPDNRFVTFWVAFIGRGAGVSIFSPALLLSS